LASKAKFFKSEHKHIRLESERLERISVKENSNEIILYHGSNHQIKELDNRFGSANNDYGRGFYLTESKQLAREWDVLRSKGVSYINKYVLYMGELKILTIKDKTTKEWISILMQNRVGNYRDTIQLAIDRYVKSNMVDTNRYDAIVGWRADDSYFAIARDFVIRLISEQQLNKAIALGNLGLQWCIKSDTGYKKLKYVGSEMASVEEFLDSAINRDRDTRKLNRRLLRNS
jgi:hypothetical protein